MWKELPVDLNDVEKYYIEDFRCLKLKPSRFGESGKYQVVPPLIDVSTEPKLTAHPFLLVSLGGIDSSLYDFPVFYEKLIEYISSNEQLSDYNIMICGGGKKFMESEFKKFERTGLTITCLGPEEHISYLKSADIVLSSAGLHGFYENYFLNKNVLFLPPQSYSQYLQLKYIQAYFRGVAAVNLEQLGIKHTLRENMPDKERIAEVKRTNRDLAEGQTWETFCQAFEMFHTGVTSTNWSIEIDRFQEEQEEQDGPAILAKNILSHVRF
jgi:hypothetical protein